jgi:hypothetical protein
MASYEAFLSRVLPEVTGCPEIIAIQAIRDAAIDFCERSHAYQQDLDPITTRKAAGEYDLEPPTGYVVARIMNAWFGPNKLVPAAPDMIRVPDAYRATPGQSSPKFYFQKTAKTFSVLPVPDVQTNSALTIRAALKPTRSSDSIDDEIFEEYAEIIAHGAKYRLMLMPAKPFSNESAAAIEKALFDAGVNKARLRANTGYVRSNLSVKLRRI